MIVKSYQITVSAIHNTGIYQKVALDRNQRLVGVHVIPTGQTRKIFCQVRLRMTDTQGIINELVLVSGWITRTLDTSIQDNSGIHSNQSELSAFYDNFRTDFDIQPELGITVYNLSVTDKSVVLDYYLEIIR